MTIWYTDESWGTSGARHAGNKAREDASAVLASMGARPIDVVREEGGASLLGKAISHIGRYGRWRGGLDAAAEDDFVVFQLPLISHTVLSPLLLRRCKSRSVGTVALVHDVESLRGASRSELIPFKMRCEEVDFLKECDVVICHNDAMRRTLCARFGLDGARCVSLGLFDYLIPDHLMPSVGQFRPSVPVIVAGNLSPSKAGFLYSGGLPFEANLYGVNFDEGQAGPGLHYQGSFLPDELPRAMRGGFGLVWDGNSCESCTGDYGEYLRINNPHKASLYLACGIPLIVWAESALAPLVRQTGAGLAVGSLSEVPERLGVLTPSEVGAMYESAGELSIRLRSGSFLKDAMEAALARFKEKGVTIG